MLDQLTSEYHLHPIMDHFTIALLCAGSAAELLAAAALLFSPRGLGRMPGWSEKLRHTSLPLMLAGAGAAVLSYFTGDSEAGRLWDSMSPAAQRILASTDGAGQYLSHAVLGHYLMYAFAILAVWRMALEFWPLLARWRIAFLVAAAVAIGGLLYQGKTGGELVYDYGVGTTAAPTRSKGKANIVLIKDGLDHDGFLRANAFIDSARNRPGAVRSEQAR
jgi:uncharacterized membrane protein